MFKGNLLTNKKFNFLMMLICFFLIAPFIIISFYSRPCADDFTYSYEVHKAFINGANIFQLIGKAFETVIDYYFSWQGTYTSAFLMSLQPGLFGEKLYFIGPLMLLLISYLCLLNFYKAVFKKLNIATNSYLLAFVTLLVSYEGLPFICDGLYWYNGSWHYMLYFFLTILNISLVIKNYDAKSPRYLIESCILSFLISGGNVVTGFVNILILLVETFLTFKKNKTTSLSLLVAIIGYIVMYISPGTLYRQSELNKDGVFLTIYEAVLYSREFVCQYANLIFIFICILAILFALLIKDKIKYQIKFNPFFSILASYAVFASTLCAPLYSTSSRGEDRVINIQWLTFIYFVAFNIIYAIIWAYQKGYIGKCEKFIKSKGFKFAIALSLIAVLASVGSNGLQIIYELKDGTAQKFASQFDERMILMKNAKEDEIVYVEPLVDSINLNFDDISQNEDNWQTIAWSSYYGVETRLKQQTIVKELKNE